MTGQYDAALDAARRCRSRGTSATSAQDEWLRGTLRMARIVGIGRRHRHGARQLSRSTSIAGRTPTCYLVELSAAQRALVRLGGTAVAIRGACYSRVARGSR